MSTIRALKPRTSAQNETIADFLRRLGNIPAGRVRLHPMPGTATEKDVIRVLDEENRPCELVEGTLVEKAMGYEESAIAAYLIMCLNNFVLPRKLGIVTGESARYGSSLVWFAFPTLPSPPGIASPGASGPRRRFLI